MSFMLQIWMKLMVLMLLMMSNLTIMTMMMILMMIRPGEGGTFCWLASQPTGWPHSPHSPHLVRKKSSIPKSQDLLEKISNLEPLIILWHLIGAITPTSILIFIAAFEFGLQKLIYIDLMQVKKKTFKTWQTASAGHVRQFRSWVLEKI